MTNSRTSIANPNLGRDGERAERLGRSRDTSDRIRRNILAHIGPSDSAAHFWQTHHRYFPLLKLIERFLESTGARIPALCKRPELICDRGEALATGRLGHAMILTPAFQRRLNRDSRQMQPLDWRLSSFL